MSGSLSQVLIYPRESPEFQPFSKNWKRILEQPQKRPDFKTTHLDYKK